MRCLNCGFDLGECNESQPVCPACGSDGTDVEDDYIDPSECETAAESVATYDALPPFHELFTLVRCDGCGTEYQIPRVSLVPCAGYVCRADFKCGRNPDFDLRRRLQLGELAELTPVLADHLWAYTIRRATPEERQAADRKLKPLLDALHGKPN